MLTTLGQRVRHTRELRGMTQQQLAKRAQLDQTTVSRIENGFFPDPSSRSINGLAGALGVSADYLINGGDQLLETKPFDAIDSLVMCTFVQAVQWGDPDSHTAFLTAVEQWKSKYGR